MKWSFSADGEDRATRLLAVAQSLGAKSFPHGEDRAMDAMRHVMNG
jgi:hypothetical protein